MKHLPGKIRTRAIVKNCWFAQIEFINQSFTEPAAFREMK